MRKIIQRIKLARSTFEENEPDAAGHFGEEVVAETINSMLNRHSKLFKSMRVPNAHRKGKQEIDFILVTRSAIILIEVKNLGGQLEVQGRSDDWIQTSRNKQRVHQNPIRLLESKKESLRIFLKDNGLTYSPKDLKHLVVLTNLRANITGQIKSNPAVVTLPELQSRLRPFINPPRQSFFRRKSTKPPLLEYDQLICQLERLPTWDEVSLYGGKRIKGDVCMDRSSHLPSRLNYRKLNLWVPRSYFMGFLVPPFFIAKKRQSFKVRVFKHKNPDKSLFIRSSGSNEFIEIPWVHVENIIYGWRDQSYFHKKNAKESERNQLKSRTN